MQECPLCKNELTYNSGLTNIHITGDEKDISIYQCHACNKSFFTVSMDAWLSTRVNYFTFMIELEQEEFEAITALIKSCPTKSSKGCNCPAHDYVDNFDYSNIRRRIIIEDIYEDLCSD